jgi:hypothetical protein
MLGIERTLKGITAATTAELINKNDTITDDSWTVKDVFFKIVLEVALMLAIDCPGFQQFLQFGEVFLELFLGYPGYNGVYQFENPTRIDVGGYDHVGAALKCLKTIGSLQLDRTRNCFEAIALVRFKFSHFKGALDTPAHEVTETAEQCAKPHASIGYLYGFHGTVLPLGVVLRRGNEVKYLPNGA